MTETLIRFRPHQLRRRHLSLLVTAMDAVQETLDRPEVLAAAGRFFERPFRDGDALSNLLRERDAHSQFYPWLLWDASFRSGSLGRRLMGRKGSGNADDRALVEALAGAAPDVYQIVTSNNGESMLERVRDGERVVVHEPVLGAVSSPGDLLVARILEHPECWLLDAVHIVLPGATRRGMVRAARRAAGLHRERRLQIIMAAAFRALARLRRRATPLRTPDGTPLIRATVTFEVVDTAAVQQGIARLVAAGSIERVGDDQLRLIDPSLGAIGATIRSRGGLLFASTRSLGRAKRLEQRLPAALAGLRAGLTVICDLGAMLDEDRAETLDDADIARMTRDWLEEYLRDLQDRPLRSLGGVTPREAVQSSAGRGRVRALVRALEPLGEVGGPESKRSLDAFWSTLMRPTNGKTTCL